MSLGENRYYHWHPEKFKKDDIIKAGDYGKLLNTIDIFYQQDKYLLEMQFELFRKTNYPYKPSRFKSIFLLKSKEDAFTYKKHVEVQTKQPYERTLYIVEVVEPNKTLHIGSTSLFNQYCLKNNYQKAAICYWESKMASLILADGTTEYFAQEIITESDVKVIGHTP